MNKELLDNAVRLFLSNQEENYNLFKALVYTEEDKRYIVDKILDYLLNKPYNESTYFEGCKSLLWWNFKSYINNIKILLSFSSCFTFELEYNKDNSGYFITDFFDLDSDKAPVEEVIEELYLAIFN